MIYMSPIFDDYIYVWYDDIYVILHDVRVGHHFSYVNMYVTYEYIYVWYDNIYVIIHDVRVILHIFTLTCMSHKITSMSLKMTYMSSYMTYVLP